MDKPSIRHIRINLHATGEAGAIYGIVERVSVGRRTVDRLLARGYLAGVHLADERRDLADLLERLAADVRHQ